MGLTAATPGAGNFRWADSSPGPGAGYYTHWGTDSDGNPEPNNMLNPELCAAANSSQTYDNPEAWGWSDTRCNTRLPFICKQTREWRPGMCAAASGRGYRGRGNAGVVLNTACRSCTAAAQHAWLAVEHVMAAR
jgi:hypothetical protein